MKTLVVLVLLAAAHRADAKGCHEVSDVVGYHKCTRFAVEWSREADAPPIAIDFGWFYHRFTALPFTLGDAPRAVGADSSFATATHGVGVRILGSLGRVLYTGLEIDAGGIDIMPRPLGMQPQDGMYMSPNVLFGAHAIERYRIALSAELAGGVRFSDFLTCTQTSGKCSGPDSTEWRRQLEARARVDVFFHPQFSIGFGYGRSLLDQTDQIWMLSFGIHGRVVDGMY